MKPIKATIQSDSTSQPLPFTAHLVFVADVPSEGKSGRLPSWPGRCLPNRPPPQLWGNRWCGGVGVAALRDHVCSTVAFPSVLWLAGRPSRSKATLTLGLACSNRPTTLTAALPAQPAQPALQNLISFSILHNNNLTIESKFKGLL